MSRSPWWRTPAATSVGHPSGLGGRSIRLTCERWRDGSGRDGTGRGSRAWEALLAVPRSACDALVLVVGIRSGERPHSSRVRQSRADFLSHSRRLRPRVRSAWRRRGRDVPESWTTEATLAVTLLVLGWTPRRRRRPRPRGAGSARAPSPLMMKSLADWVRVSLPFVRLSRVDLGHCYRRCCDGGTVCPLDHRDGRFGCPFQPRPTALKCSHPRAPGSFCTVRQLRTKLWSRWRR